MPYGTKSAPVGPAYGGDGGGKFCVVHAHNRPRRGNACSAISVEAHRGQDCCAGNVTMPHTVHLLPTSCGSSDGQVKTPSAIGTCAITHRLSLPSSIPSAAHRCVRAAAAAVD